MGHQIHQSLGRAVWGLARRQHGVVARRQLLELGFSADAIKHRVETGRLHPVWRGVYAVGRPELTRHGRLMAAVLACGPGAVLSHESAAELWQMRRERGGPIDVSVTTGSARRLRGVRVHRRTFGFGDVTEHDGIPVTSPICTLIDVASKLVGAAVERAVNEGDRQDLFDFDELRDAIEAAAGRPGVGKLRQVLDRRTFTFTESELERRFLPIARRTGLPTPLTQAVVNGFRVDFYWPELPLIVETDGLRYHRTPAQQARDRLRDQIHTAAGITTLRFTHAQVRYEPRRVEAVLASVRDRLMN